MNNNSNAISAITTILMRLDTPTRVFVNKYVA